jgi:hypothetical protein
MCRRPRPTRRREGVICAKSFSRIFGDQFPYLIPVGVIFAMIIFMPQGLLGFARRWLNQ